MTAETEMMSLLERADPVRRGDAPPMADAAQYLEQLLTTDRVVAAVDLVRVDYASTDERVEDTETSPSTHGARRRWRVLAAAAAAAALIVATIVVVRTASDDGGTVLTPAGPAPPAPAPAPSTPSPASPAPLPDGLKGLPPEGATPSTPPTGQLVAPLPIPIWVYEDGRVISARWTTHDHWTGFLEQRLTPEGVELVRAEILALEPYEGCGSGPPYWYGDGSRDVWEQPGGANMCPDRPQYQRLSELQYGAVSWLPASAWADPEPKPYVPSTYLIWIYRSGPVVGGISNAEPIDTTAMLAALPTETAELLTSPGPCPPSGAPIATPGPAHRTVGVCFQVTTDVARQVSTAVGITGSEPGPPGKYAGYSIVFTPYLPHSAPVECCAA